MKCLLKRIRGNAVIPDRLSGQYSVLIWDHRVPTNCSCDIPLFLALIVLLACGVVVANTFLVRLTTDADGIHVVIVVAFGGETLCSIHCVHTESTKIRQIESYRLSDTRFFL